MSDRLLMVSQPTDGGVAVCVRELSRAAVDQGFAVTVACPDGELAEWAQNVGARWYRVPMGRSPSFSDARHVSTLRHLMRQADVVHLHSSKAGALGRLALLSLGSKAPPSAFTPHNWSWCVGGVMGNAYAATEWLLAPVTDIIVCVARGEMDDGKRLLDHRPRRAVLIPNGVSLTSYTPDGPVAPRSGDPLIVLVGRLSKAKGQDIALSSLHLMRDRRARLRFIGDGPTRLQLDRRAAALGLQDRVEWQGHDDPRPHLRAADVVIIPSRWDAAPLVLAEAMGCAAAIVCSDAVGSLDTLGNAGVVVPVGDSRALADAIDELIASPQRRGELGLAARCRALDLPTVEDSCRQHLQLWHNLQAVRG